MGATGGMPRSKQFGYLFTKTALKLGDKAIYRTIAHELSHGAFSLNHTFDSQYHIVNGSTQNLMDYTSGTDLVKHQWDAIHNPGLVIGMFERDEEGAMMATSATVDSMYLYSGTNRIQPNSYQLISTSPAMPDIRIKPFKNNYTGSEEIEAKIKIEDKRRNRNNTQVRNDSIFYPSNGWQKVKINEIWDVDFGTEMRGGKVYVYYKSGNITKSEIFYIRGSNPTEQDIRNYLTTQGYNEWFLMKLMREESNSIIVGQPMRHFVTDTNYDQEWSYNSPGFPTLGNPHGFGLMQLDNFGTANGTLLVANPNQIWNWKANIDRGVHFLRDDKIDWAERRINGNAPTINQWNRENQNNQVNDSIYIDRGDNARTTVLTIQEGNTTNNETFAITPTGTQRRIQDALALKYYNGGSYCTLKRKATTNKPYWAIDRLNNLNPPFNYVERVCGRNQ